MPRLRICFLIMCGEMCIRDRVISADGQVELKGHEVVGRTITLDVKALDRNGTEIDIEVQGNAEGAHVRRARYHLSLIHI